MGPNLRANRSSRSASISTSIGATRPKKTRPRRCESLTRPQTGREKGSACWKIMPVLHWTTRTLPGGSRNVGTTSATPFRLCRPPDCCGHERHRPTWGRKLRRNLRWFAKARSTSPWPLASGSRKPSGLWKNSASFGRRRPPANSNSYVMPRTPSKRRCSSPKSTAANSRPGDFIYWLRNRCARMAPDQRSGEPWPEAPGSCNFAKRKCPNAGSLNWDGECARGPARRTPSTS